jgi:polysaccharide deacetylase family protein (PEP-CTERM system associated)
MSNSWDIAELAPSNRALEVNRFEAADQAASSSVLTNRNDVTRQHILTVGVEDWFQVGSFHNLIEAKQWYRFETRIEKSTHATLDLLDQFNTKATFFVLGWIAERMPELVRRIADRGHEVASRGYLHQPASELCRDTFRDDVVKTQQILEAAAGHKILGHRLSDGWMTPDDLWMLDVLASEGYGYDSSVCPIFRQFSNEPWRRFLHEQHTDSGKIWEVPPSTSKMLAWTFPVSGGNWFRQLPHRMLKRVIDRWDRKQAEPFVMYFHTWELDPDQPRISAVNRFTKLRHYRNLDKMRWVLEDYLEKYQFGTVAGHLGVDLKSVNVEQQPKFNERSGRVLVVANSDQTDSTSTAAPIDDGPRTDPAPVSIVIPCYNEEGTLPYLAKTLERLEFELSDKYIPQFIFVDDCSSDETWSVLESIFGGKSNCKRVKHAQNSGVSAAILTGIQAADTEVVCSMDCDCSYDPLEFKNMLPLLADDVAMVTASPYHPEGRVKNVPSWRLLLSKGLSQLYRIVLPPKLHTWTSCFRVYRKSAVQKLKLTENGFLGTAEMVAELSLNGEKIVEHPATLEVRIFGESKMKTVHTIFGHLRLTGRFLKARFKARRGTQVE